MGDAGRLQRHDMVQLDPQAWARILAGRPERATTPILAGWCGRGWPLVGRRRAEADAPGDVPLGLPLPPGLGKLRLCFTAPPDAVRRIAPPPLLSAAAAAAPPAWRDTLHRLVALAPAARVFGSLAWQHLTALPYLSATSDLDMLWPLPGTDLRCLLDGIAAIAATAPMRIDGEITRPDGSGANWQELIAAPDILVKQPDGVVLMRRQDFLEPVR